VTILNDNLKQDTVSIAKNQSVSAGRKIIAAYFEDRTKYRRIKRSFYKLKKEAQITAAL
jgi:hypothetical protein